MIVTPSLAARLAKANRIRLTARCGGLFLFPHFFSRTAVHDLRFAWRLIVRHSAFTAVVILILFYLHM